MKACRCHRLPILLDTPRLLGTTRMTRMGQVGDGISLVSFLRVSWDLVDDVGDDKLTEESSDSCSRHPLTDQVLPVFCLRF
jgi:hypothetical protein